jgi:hypothetical protein
MNDAQDHLDLLARDVSSPVPAGLLDAARSARRRRTRGRLAVGGAVAAVAVVALAVTLPGGAGPAPRPETPVAVPSSRGPVAPDGTRWISQDGYMVAVPADWERTTTNCGGAVMEDDAASYYLEVDNNWCAYLGPDVPSVGLVERPALSRVAALSCEKTCAQGVARGSVELLVRGLATAEEVTAVVDTLQPLPDGWTVNPTTGSATPYDVSVPRSRLVTDRDDVVGAWTVVQVAGGPVPSGAERRLDIAATGRASLDLTYSDEANGHGAAVRVRSDGTLVRGQMYSTTVMCPPPSCSPSGFGVLEATRLRLTPDGDLVLVGPDGTALAVYERA